METKHHESFSVQFIQSKSKMAAAALFVVALLLPSVGALTDHEVSRFMVRNHTEKNTNLQGEVTVTSDGDYHRVRSNGIPDHTTGTFPGKGNPNTVSPFNFNYRITKNPTVAASVTCLPNGPIAFTRNGIPLFNPFNIDGENAVEGDTAEVFDSCNGHPADAGIYHYHQTPNCVYDEGNDEFIGVALDGFPIYGIKDSNGNEIKSADLDQCHGREENGQYRYRLTLDYPYIMGCFKGTVSPDVQEHRLTDSSCKVIPQSAASSLGVMSLFYILAICLLSQIALF